MQLLSILGNPSNVFKKKLNLLAKEIGNLSVIFYFNWLTMKEALACRPLIWFLNAGELQFGSDIG